MAKRRNWGAPFRFISLQNLKREEQRAKAEQARAKYKESHPTSDPVVRSARATCIATAALVGVTVGLGIVAYWQYQTLEKTDLTLKDTLAANKLEQRAWVYPAEIKFGNVLEFGNGVAVARVQIALKNTGKLPAINVFAFAELFPHTGKFTIADTTPIDGCYRDPVNTTVGTSIFPQANVPFVPIVPRGRLPLVEKGRTVQLVLGVCVRYRSQADETVNRTVYWGIVVRDEQSNMLAFQDFDPSARYDASRLSLRAMPLGAQPK